MIVSFPPLNLGRHLSTTRSRQVDSDLSLIALGEFLILQPTLKEKKKKKKHSHIIFLIYLAYFIFYILNKIEFKIESRVLESD